VTRTRPVFFDNARIATSPGAVDPSVFGEEARCSYQVIHNGSVLAHSGQTSLWAIEQQIGKPMLPWLMLAATILDPEGEVFEGCQRHTWNWYPETPEGLACKRCGEHTPRRLIRMKLQTPWREWVEAKARAAA